MSKENNGKSLLMLRLEDNIEEAKLHIKRINFALSKLKYTFPLTKDIYKNITEDDILIFDQLIYRYTKLQDKIGQSLIKNISILLEGDDDKRTFIDCLNILERHEIIEHALIWDKLRSLRNKLTHEYDQDIKKQVLMFNDLKKGIDYLVKIFENISACIEKYK